MSTSPKKKLLTGLQSSGALHIGNYFGALKPFADIYQDYESMLMVADYHSITSLRGPDGAKELRQNTIDVVKDYLACGIDPNKAIIFKQSDVPEHTELAWVLSSVMPMRYLELAHAYKDKVAKGIDANVGLFTYPILMAADILLYDTEVVPVGEDQRQHVEYSREAAKKFNNAYSALLVEPKEMILEGTGIVPGTDGGKMSKSRKNTIPLFGTKDEITKAVKTIVTDSSGDFPEHVYAIHRLLKTEAELAPLYEENKGKYGNLKNALIEDLEAFIAPMRAKRDAITDEDVKRVLSEGNAKARAIAQAKMNAIRTMIGINL
jgi:tryptophanyl-tRNA synthetase